MNTKNIITAYLIKNQDDVSKINLPEPYIKMCVPRIMSATETPISDVYRLIFWDKKKKVAIYAFVGEAK